MSTKFHPPHKTADGHEFSINDHGTGVMLRFDNDTQGLLLSASAARQLREWLNHAELRTQDEHDALVAAEAKNPRQEVNTGTKVEMNDGTHLFAQTPEELAKLQHQAKLNLDKATQEGAMKITVESTEKLVQFEVKGAVVPARIWEGETDDGIPVHCYITRICPSIPEPLPADVDQKFAAALKVCVPPIPAVRFDSATDDSVRRQPRPFKLPCGCTVTVDIVEQFCTKHSDDWAQRHEQARRDHQGERNREHDCKDYSINDSVRP